MGVRFGFITDVHFGQPARHEGKLRKLSQYAEALTQQFVQRMNEVEKPNVAVNLGDVIEDESFEADRRHYNRFVELMRGNTADVLHVAGNHDLVNLSDDDLRQSWGHKGPLFYSRDIQGVHAVILRTEHRRAKDVRLPREQIEWLQQDLANTSLPTLVFVHHPLCEQRLIGNRWFEKQPHICRVAERREVRGILESSQKVVGVVNGHVHWNYLDVINGIPYMTVQSITENVEDDAPGRPSEAMAILDLDEFALNLRITGQHPANYRFVRRH